MLTTTPTSIDEREQELVACERLIGRLRAKQLGLLRSLDADQVRLMDGSRTMADWTAARLDVGSETARELVGAAKRFSDHADIETALLDGDVSFDRALATANLAASGAPAELVAASGGYDIAGVRRLVARHRRVTPVEEREAFDRRRVAIQPNLDLSNYRGWFELPGFEGKILEEALLRRADDFPTTGDEQRARRSTRLADALVSIAQDSLDVGGVADGEGRALEPLGSIFIDAELAARTRGESGVEIEAGPRVGPALLERILCGGRVQVIGVRDGEPIWASHATRAIPPAVRRFVLHRDGGCVVDGCSSRYRLQVHHITQRAHGGDHDPRNLVTLCWYHHHVAIHGAGYRLDPGSPPHRRRLLPPIRAPDQTNVM